MPKFKGDAEKFLSKPRTQVDLAEHYDMTLSRSGNQLNEWYKAGKVKRSDQQVIVVSPTTGRRLPTYCYIATKAHIPGRTYFYGTEEITFNGIAPGKPEIDILELAILDFLGEKGASTSREILTGLNMPKSTFERHVKRLVEKGFVLKWGKDGAYGRRRFVNEGYIWAKNDDPTQAHIQCVAKAEEIRLKAPVLVHNLIRIIQADSRSGKVTPRLKLVSRLHPSEREKLLKGWEYYKRKLQDLGIRIETIPRTNVCCLYDPRIIYGSQLQASLEETSKEFSEYRLRKMLAGHMWEAVTLSAISVYYNDLGKKVKCKTWASVTTRLGERRFSELDLIARVELPKFYDATEIAKSHETGKEYYRQVPHVTWYIFEVKGYRIAGDKLKDIDHFAKKLLNGTIYISRNRRLIASVEAGHVLGVRMKTLRPDIKPILVALDFEKQAYRKAEALGITCIHANAFLNVLRSRFNPHLTQTKLVKAYDGTPIEEFYPASKSHDYKAIRRRFVKWLFNDLLKTEVPSFIKF